MRKLGIGNRFGVVLVAVLFAMMGVSTGWNATAVSAQDEDVTAAAVTPGTNAVVSNGPLNQRSLASTSGSVLQVLSTGTVVAVISGPTSANGYNWYLVNANSVEGYVAGQYLSEVGFDIGDDVYVDAVSLNVRRGAGTGYSVIDVISSGTIGEIIGGPQTANGYTWYRLQYEGTLTGWVAGSYLALSSTPPPSGGFGIGSWLLVDDPPVNMRSGAGTGYSVVLSLGSNAAVWVTGTSSIANGYTWYPVSTASGTEGFVAGSFFEGGFYLADNATVADGPLNLRATASSSGTILATMPSGASIYINSDAPVFSGGQTWFNVTYNGTSGWAAGSYLGPA